MSWDRVHLHTADAAIVLGQDQHVACGIELPKVEPVWFADDDYSGRDPLEQIRESLSARLCRRCREWSETAEAARYTYALVAGQDSV